MNFGIASDFSLKIPGWDVLLLRLAREFAGMSIKVTSSSMK